MSRISSSDPLIKGREGQGSIRAKARHLQGIGENCLLRKAGGHAQISKGLQYGKKKGKRLGCEDPRFGEEEIREEGLFLAF